MPPLLSVDSASSDDQRWNMRCDSIPVRPKDEMASQCCGRLSRVELSQHIYGLWPSIFRSCWLLLTSPRSSSVPDRFPAFAPRKKMAPTLRSWLTLGLLALASPLTAEPLRKYQDLAAVDARNLAAVDERALDDGLASGVLQLYDRVICRSIHNSGACGPICRALLVLLVLPVLRRRRRYLERVRSQPQ